MARSRNRTSSRKIRYAVIGQGAIAQMAVLPAFSHARSNSDLAALVSGDPKKLRVLGRRYKVPRLCSYDDLDELYESGAIDAVYIALPNNMHEAYTVQAAQAGLHVLCEKPMAVSTRSCRRMIDVCQRHDVKLMIAYRLHFERATLETIDMARRGQLGELRFFSSQFSMQVKDRTNIRLDREKGGGPLFDIGIYCINAARALFRAEPVAVQATEATSRDPRFREVPEAVACTLDFGRGRVGSFICSFGAGDTAAFQFVGTKGSLHMESAYEYATPPSFEMRVGERRIKHRFKKSDQFAPELLYFSECVIRHRDPEPSGYEGLADVAVIEALQRAMVSGRRVPVKTGRLSLRRPSLEQEKRRPPVRKRKLIRARSATD